MMTPLKKARLASRKTLAEVAGAVGTSKVSLSRLENRIQRASPKLAEKLARYFGSVSEIEILYPERFLTGEGEAA